MGIRTLACAILGAAFIATAGASWAQDGQKDSPQDALKAKYGPTKSAPGAAVYFIDPKDGATIPPKTTVHFGLHGMGIAPAGSDRPNSGHHHLLIDTDLPPLDQPIPNDFNHLHFGAGQTEGEIELAPGKHTLQLLLADRNHIPHNPPIVSDKITVNVVDPSDASAPKEAYKRKASPKGAKVYIISPANGAVVPPDFTVRFGLVGMGVAPAGMEKAYTGHHHLVVDAPLPPLDQPIPNDFNYLHFGLGQTEAQVSLPPGPHTLQLLLGDANHTAHDPVVASTPIKIIVSAGGKAPVRKSRGRYRYRHY